MKIAIVGGGTGGHIIPGINIGNELMKLGYEVIYIGSVFGIEKDMDLNMKKFLIPVSGWVREYLKRRILFFIRLIKSFFKAFKILRKENPFILVFTGGFVSVPFIPLSILLNKPFFLLEINSIPGRAAKILSYFSRATFIGFDSAKDYLYRTKNVYITGIPVSERLNKVSREESAEFFKLMKEIKTILIFGGSRGSKRLNMIAEEIIKRKKDYQFIVIGRDDLYAQNVRSFKFLKEMEYAYSLSDIVVSRAGAMTCGEIMFLNKPAILIPYPYAYKNHQYFNALELKKSMKNIYIMKEDELDIEKIIEIINNVKICPMETDKINPSKIIAERINSYVQRI
jgi:UDP-N-acetylglucosamine--N-acetylmuramyl-(pentapeptide) pyrophosphoryl-undecaprenol N-acetylglucosamine transferase